MPAAVEMVMNWPHLESLFLECLDDIDDDSGTSFQTCDALQRFQPSPQLSDLTLLGVDLTDQDLARVLDGSPVLTDLHLCMMYAGEASFTSLVNLVGTLTSLCISYPRDRGYWRTRRLLRSLPKLVEFRCQTMDVDDMYFDTILEGVHHLSARRQQQYEGRIQTEIGNEPGIRQAKKHLLGQWTCSGLRLLEIEELILSLDADRNQALMDQLGSLQHIKGFIAFSTFRRVLVIEVSDYYLSSLATAGEAPKMDGAIKISLTETYLEGRSDMRPETAMDSNPMDQDMVLQRTESYIN